MTSRTPRLLAVLLAGALVLGACGDDDDAADDPDETTSTTAEETTDGDDEATDDDTGTDDAGTDDGGEAGTDDGDSTTDDGGDTGTTGGGERFDTAILGSVSNFCELDELGDEAFDSLFVPDSDDIEERKAAFEMLGAFYLRAVQVAPDEIRADVEAVTAAVEPLYDLIEEYDYDTEALFQASQADPEVAAKIEALNSPEMEAASDRVDDWVDANCD